MYFALFIFASILTSIPVSATEKHGSRFPADVTLGVQAKEFNLGLISPENIVSHGLRVFRCLLANSKWSIVPFTEEWFPSDHYTIKA